MELKYEARCHAGERPAAVGEAGFSLIEALIAAVIVLVITLGLVPLIAGSMASTAAGRDYSVASQHGRSRIDEIYQMPSDSDDLSIPDAGTEIALEEFWVLAEKRWEGTEPTEGLVPWERQTTIRQYNIGDAVDQRLDDPLAGNTPAPQVHLREVIVEVESSRVGGTLGAGRGIGMTTLKGF